MVSRVRLRGGRDVGGGRFSVVAGHHHGFAPTTAPPTTAPPTTVATDGSVVAAGRTLAVADLALTTSDKSVSIHVLQNDDFGNSSADLSTLVVVAGPSHGSVTVTGQNLLYIPAPGYVGTDSMSYSICSLSGSCDQATVLVTITP